MQRGNGTIRDQKTPSGSQERPAAASKVIQGPVIMFQVSEQGRATVDSTALLTACSRTENAQVNINRESVKIGEKVEKAVDKGFRNPGRREKDGG